MTRYSYDGPVMFFETLIEDHFKAETIAPSARKAKSNLAYQFKQKHQFAPGAKISLPGKIKEVI